MKMKLRKLKGEVVGNNVDEDLSTKEGNDAEKIRAFLEYHGFCFEEGSDNGITSYLRIDLDDYGNVI